MFPITLTMAMFYSTVPVIHFLIYTSAFHTVMSKCPLTFVTMGLVEQTTDRRLREEMFSMKSMREKKVPYYI